MALTGKVLVYNHGGFEVLGVVPMQHAINMLWRKVAKVRVAMEGPKIGPYERPRALELMRRVGFSVVSSRGRVPYSKVALWIRDDGLCGYCLEPGDTMDHILPKSRGGRAEWSNAVTACAPCNERKADRTPEEAGMPLLLQPYEPTWIDLFGGDSSIELTPSAA